MICEPINMSEAKCEVSEEQRARARDCLHKAGVAAAQLAGPGSFWAEVADHLALFAAQEAQRANERAEGLAKELVALRAELAEARQERALCQQRAQTHLARVAELEATLAHVERSGGIEQCLAREARVAELERQMADTERLRAAEVLARDDQWDRRKKAEARATAAEAELARLRAQLGTNQ